jgi:glyoxylase-like metal-dependent hydrolase (beta-lactamase superfamily II)
MQTLERMTRRELLRVAGLLGGGALASKSNVLAWAGHLVAQNTAVPPDQLAAMRAQMGAAPIQVTKLNGSLNMLSGPGGNVIVLNGSDGKIVVDSFVLPAWQSLRAALDKLGPAAVKVLIDTHWHFDHADNNANFRGLGSEVLAHENTRKRLSESHELLGMRVPPAPAAALPTQTFAVTHSLQAGGEQIALSFVPPAHTDTDVFVHFGKANVLHMGDVFFNGMYPFIDAGTGGNINGMVAGAERALKLADARTQIVPGHGPVADRGALTRYRDVLAAVRDRVQKLKKAGQSLAEVQAAKPSGEFDATWGKGMMAPNDFIALVYNTL